MNTNRSFRTIIALFVIAILASMLAACSPRDAMKFVADASYSEDGVANYSTLQISPRIDTCDMSSNQLLLNAINSETNKETGVVDGYTIGSWLDSKMGSYTCIEAASK